MNSAEHSGMEQQLSGLRDAFVRDGYLKIDRLVDDATVVALREVYDGMLDGRIPCPGTDRMLGTVTRQIMSPSRHHVLFRDNAALTAARAIAAEILACAAPVPVYDMLIHKPPGHGASTPWHQDYAYAHMPVTRAGTRVPHGFVQFWLALDDVDETTGCMQFVPGVQHAPLLPHIVASGDPREQSRLLTIAGPGDGVGSGAQLPFARAIACPLAAGGCTAHGPGTPHYTGPNTSATRQRRAYIFNFAVPV